MAELLDERDADERQNAVQSEFVGVFPDRASVPRDTWLQLVGSATRHIDVLGHLAALGSVEPDLTSRTGACGQSVDR